MSKGLLFWVLMILWLIFGCVIFWPAGGGGGLHGYYALGNQFLAWVLFALLGWQVFGAAVK